MCSSDFLFLDDVCRPSIPIRLPSSIHPQREIASWCLQPPANNRHHPFLLAGDCRTNHIILDRKMTKWQETNLSNNSSDFRELKASHLQRNSLSPAFRDLPRQAPVPIPALQRLDAWNSHPQRNVLGTPSLLLPDLISSWFPYLCGNTVSFGFREGITSE